MTTPGDVLGKLDEWIREGGHPEDPPGSNHNDITEAFADWSGWDWMRRGEPWCAAGASLAQHETGLPTNPHASCLEWIAALERGEGGTWIGFDPGAVQPGDVVFWGPNGGSHVSTIVAPGIGGAFTRGCNERDAVRYTWRPYRGAGFDAYGFGRPAYDGAVVNYPPPAPADPSAPPPPALASIAMPVIDRQHRHSNDKRAVRIHQVIVGANPDGDFGPDTQARTFAWQRFFGLAVDGQVGDKTWTIGLQFELHQAGGTQVEIDGEIGPVTTAVLLYYQAVNGLTVDGVAGEDTFGRLTGQ